MGKPNYRVTVSYDRERSVYTARTPELEHLTGEGPTRADCIARLEEEIDAQLANMLSHGTTPPQALDDVQYSGEVTAKVSRALHRELSHLARSEGVELDQLVSELLSAALTTKQHARGTSARPQRPPAEMADDIGNRVVDGNRADGGGGGGNHRRGFPRGGANPQIMDDRANFIEYVRGLEHGNAGGAPRHGGGQGGHRGGGGGGGGSGGGGGGHGDANRRRRGGGGGGGGGGGRGPGGPGGHNRDQHRQHGGGHGQRPQQPHAQGAPTGAAPAAHAPSPGSDSHES